MDKEQILTKIQDCGIVAVVRAEKARTKRFVLPMLASRAELQP